MRKYKAKINGTMYEIEIELVRGNNGSSFSGSPSLPPQVSGGVSRPAPAPAPRPAAPAPAPAPAPASAASSAPAAAGEEQVTAPMPGTILSVGPGSVVKKGQVLMSLEAMKMENEIMASRDGQIVSVNVTAGSAVEAGALLCVIK